MTTLAHATLSTDALAQRLAAGTEPEPNSGCWLWLGSDNGHGYGLMAGGRRGQQFYVHRLAYELTNGSIPEGKEIDHLCRVRRCVNPAHLEIVDHRTNILRGQTWGAANHQKTHCPQGHPYDLAKPIKGQARWRGCLRCRADAEQRRRARLAFRSA